MEAVEGAAIMIVAVDATGKVVHVSRSAERVFGSVAGLDLSNPPASDDPRGPLASLVGVWEECRNGGESSEPRILRAKIQGVPVFLWLQVVATGGESAPGCAFVMLDLTATMTGSEPVRALLSQLAHDLRSPLTSISGAAELLLSGRVGELVGAQHRLVKIVDDGTQKMATIISSVYEEGREGGGAR